jgi:hypothetical protein
MKFRHGFVSNSSSSNFVLAFDKKPASVAELCRLMFDGAKTWEDEDYEYRIAQEQFIPTLKIAQAVYVQLNKELALDEILEEFTNGWLLDDNDNDNDNDNDPPKWDSPERQEWEDAEQERINIKALEYFNNWKCPNDQVFFTVSFSDNESAFYSMCEHSGIFFNIHNVQISHH